MKALKSHTLFLSVIIMALMMHACKEDDFEVPQASTQADFDFTVNEIIIDEEIDSVNWQLDFTNKSILAQSYNWDFGNGETSAEENPSVLLTQAGKYNISLTVDPLNDVYYNKLSKPFRWPWASKCSFLKILTKALTFGRRQLGTRRLASH